MGRTTRDERLGTVSDPLKFKKRPKSVAGRDTQAERKFKLKRVSERTERRRLDERSRREAGEGRKPRKFEDIRNFYRKGAIRNSGKNRKGGAQLRKERGAGRKLSDDQKRKTKPGKEKNGRLMWESANEKGKKKDSGRGGNSSERGGGAFFKVRDAKSALTSKGEDRTS